MRSYKIQTKENQPQAQTQAQARKVRLTDVCLVAILIGAGGVLAFHVAQLPLRVVVHVEHLYVGSLWRKKVK